MQVLVLGPAALVALMQVQRNTPRPAPAWRVSEAEFLTPAPNPEASASQKR